MKFVMLFVVFFVCTDKVFAQYSGTLYGSNGVNQKGCPAGYSPFTTKADCDTMAAAIVAGGSGTAYDELLAILKLEDNSFVFGSNAVGQTTSFTSSGNSYQGVGCTMNGNSGGNGAGNIQFDATATGPYENSGNNQICGKDPIYKGTLYGTNGVGQKGCPAGYSPFTTKADCDTMAAAIVAGGSGTAYDELLAILKLEDNSFVFGSTAEYQTESSLSSGNSRRGVGCSMMAASSSSIRGYMFYDATGTGPDADTAQICAPAPAGNSGSNSGDPHLQFHNGGHADFRGGHNETYVTLSAPNISVAATTMKSDFAQKGGAQVVHGTHFTAAYLVVRTNQTGRIVNVSVTAPMTPWFSPYSSVFVRGMPTVKVAFKKSKPAWLKAFALEDVNVTAVANNAVRVTTAGWVVEVVRRTLYKPLTRSSPRHYLNLEYRKKTAGAAHGIVGQSFGFTSKVDGKVDNYTLDDKEVTTAAQAEGAIEGVYTDYRIKSWFDTKFKFSLFDANLTAAGASLAAPVSARTSDLADDGAFSLLLV